MRFILAFLLTALVSFAAGLFLPWWSIAVAAFLVALTIPLRPWQGFLAGFSGLFLCWGMIALVRDMKNNSILSGRVAELFYLNQASFLLIIITAFIAGLIGGFAFMTGTYLRVTRNEVED